MLVFRRSNRNLHHGNRRIPCSVATRWWSTYPWKQSGFVGFRLVGLSQPEIGDPMPIVKLVTVHLFHSCHAPAHLIRDKEYLSQVRRKKGTRQ